MVKYRQLNKEFQKDWEYFITELKKSFKELTKKQTFKKQLPNLLTIIRICSPLIIIPIAMSDNLLLTSLIVALVALTDFFDGYLARKWNCSSKIGAWLDAISDKLFAYGVIIPLILKYPFISTALIILETMITFINFSSHLKGNTPSSKPIGKLKAWSLSITIVLAYLVTTYPNLTQIFHMIFSLTVILQISAIIDYISTDHKKEKQKKQLIKTAKLAS